MTVYDGTTGVDTFTGTSGDDVFQMTNDIGPTQDTLHGGDGNDEFFYDMNDYSAGTPPYSPLAQIYGDGGQNKLVFDNSLNNVGAIPAVDMTGCSILDIQTIDIVHGGTAVFNASQFGAGLIPWNATIEIGSGYGGAIEIDGQSDAANTIDASGFLFQEDSGVGAGFTLVGGSQADTLIANAQSIGDYLVGGDGDDTYVVYGATAIQETAGQGADTVEARASYALAAGVSIELLETADASATTAINLTGNEVAQTIVGNAGKNTLDGGGGGDVLVGGGGNDTYIVSGGDAIEEAAGQGTDTVETRTSYTLAAGVSIELLETANAGATTAINLTGNELAQRIVGNAGNNTIDGGGGADVLVGGAGNDTYIVHGGEAIQEVVGQGTDTVKARASYTLAAGVSIELLETANASATTAINLTGNALRQKIVGNAGKNKIDGGGGADVLIGGAGNDRYIVYGGEAIQEAAGQGTDTVKAHASYKLAAGVSIELLETANASATTAINLTGNAFAQRIVGNIGRNTLDGGGGADVLIGGGGNDTYVVSNKTVIREAAGEGADTAKARTSYTLAVGVSIELLETANASATLSINLVGNAFAQRIVGNAGRNTIDGGDGDDVLVGGAGNDTFAFSTKLGAGNVDQIKDFNLPTDAIALSHAIFSKAGAVGALSSKAFVVGAASADASDRIIYNAASGALYYDRDGAGDAAKVQFATLAPQLALTAADFRIV